MKLRYKLLQCLHMLKFAQYAYAMANRVACFSKLAEVCEICEDYSHSTYACPYYPKYGRHHYSSCASPQPDFFGLMPSPQIPQHEESYIPDMMNDLIFGELSFQQQCHEENQQLQQNTSLEDMMKQLIDGQQRLHEELHQFQHVNPGLQNLESQLIQINTYYRI
ncbi:hypothetical protein Scep_029493 [Stephania cephalantha]|uniref:Uncharacterized protein n=1 Tax=Stephania cephalantha TaxID=152367 RepID=A0AAP0HFN1_9MAGN